VSRALLIVAYRSFGRFWQARHPPRKRGEASTSSFA
jgi:hypothetical protein